MKCPHCKSAGKVLSTRSALDGLATKRRNQCGANKSHRWTTIEIYESAFSAAKSDIEKWVAKEPARRADAEKAAWIDSMKSERLSGATCASIAEKHGITLFMARHWTRMPRERLYPGAKKEKRS